MSLVFTFIIIIIFNSYYKKIITAWIWDTVAQTPYILRPTEITGIFKGINPTMQSEKM
jgi:hypothetical protein